jgi:hypothetical protein
VHKSASRLTELVDGLAAEEMLNDALDEDKLDDVTPLLRILHQSFVDVHEIYFFDREVFVITEHVGLSLEDMLENSVCLSEPDIAYIIGKVSLTLSLSTLYSSDVLDFGRYMLHLV